MHIGNVIAPREATPKGNLNRMPLNSDSPSTNSRQEFCLALKAARERKGITLAEIANTTKIPASVFAAFERNDLRRWPKGLFRRSFFRDYARMIGVPLAETCAEFVRLFPDDDSAPAKAAAPAGENDQAEPLPLVLDAAWHGPRSPVLLRLLAAVIDGAGVGLASAAIAWVSGMDQLATTTIFALSYFSLATVVLDESPAKWAIARRRPVLDKLAQGPAAVAAAWTRVADAVSHALGSAAVGAAEAAEEPAHAWVTDARRVGSAPPPRFRVRIKVPQ